MLFRCLVFGGEPSFCPTCLLCLHSLDCSVLCSCFLFWVLLLLSSFAGFCFMFCLSSSSWVFVFLAAVWSCWFFNFMSWLLVYACGFWCFHFVVNLVGGVFLVGPTGRGQYIFGFSHNRSVWAKTGAALGEEGLCARFWLQNRACKRRKSLSVFNFVAGNAVKIWFSEAFFLKKSAPPLFTKRTSAIILL